MMRSGEGGSSVHPRHCPPTRQSYQWLIPAAMLWVFDHFSDTFSMMIFVITASIAAYTQCSMPSLRRRFCAARANPSYTYLLSLVRMAPFTCVLHTELPLGALVTML